MQDTHSSTCSGTGGLLVDCMKGNWADEIDSITKRLEYMQAAQDETMRLSREIVRLCGTCINSVHCKDMKKAKACLLKCKRMLNKLAKAEPGFEYYSAQARQEYVEAYAVYSIASSGKLPANSEIKEDPRNYIMGLMDVVGELKREALEAMRSGDLKAAERHYSMMCSIYDSTMHIRFANALLPGFRKKQDVARIVMESTGSDLLMAKARAKGTLH